MGKCARKEQVETSEESSMSIDLKENDENNSTIVNDRFSNEKNLKMMTCKSKVETVKF